MADLFQLHSQQLAECCAGTQQDLNKHLMNKQKAITSILQSYITKELGLK